MGTWNIQFSDNNAAFADEPATECARILRELADKFEAGGPDCEYISENIRDINGNTVGYVTYYHDDEPAP
jgi:hypothetical protein